MYYPAYAYYKKRILNYRAIFGFVTIGPQNSAIFIFEWNFKLYLIPLLLCCWLFCPGVLLTISAETIIILDMGTKISSVPSYRKVPDP